MQVVWYPTDPQSGIVSFLRWDSPDFRAAMRQAFNANPNERIIRIEVMPDGLKAFFEKETTTGEPAKGE